MIKLNQPIIVEGKYDKITLENVVDTLILTTEGFGIFKNRQKRELIRTLAKRDGIIVMTDSDSAGSTIRAYIKKIANDGEIINVYLPFIKGKEKRKSAPSKTGVLGVEGMSKEIILEALERSGVTTRRVERNSRKITKADLFELGLSGNPNSSEKRKELLYSINLPVNLSSNAMLDILNTLYTFEEFLEVMENVKTK